MRESIDASVAEVDDPLDRLAVAADEQPEVLAHQRAGEAVIGLAIGVTAGGGLDVDPAHRTPAHREPGLVHDLGTGLEILRLGHDAGHDDGIDLGE